MTVFTAIAASSDAYSVVLASSVLFPQLGFIIGWEVMKSRAVWWLVTVNSAVVAGLQTRLSILCRLHRCRLGRQGTDSVATVVITIPLEMMFSTIFLLHPLQNPVVTQSTSHLHLDQQIKSNAGSLEHDSCNAEVNSKLGLTVAQ